jgi:hypothetical protein
LNDDDAPPASESVREPVRPRRRLEPLEVPLFDPLPTEAESFWRRWSFATSAAVFMPWDRKSTFVDTGAHYAGHLGYHASRYVVLDLSGGYYAADIRTPFSDKIESLTAQAGIQVGGELPLYMDTWYARGYIEASIGYLLLDEEEVGEPFDIATQAGVGLEFWSLDLPIRTRVGAGYLRLQELEEEFLVVRLTLLLKF